MGRLVIPDDGHEHTLGWAAEQMMVFADAITQIVDHQAAGGRAAPSPLHIDPFRTIAVVSPDSYTRRIVDVGPDKLLQCTAVGGGGAVVVCDDVSDLKSGGSTRMVRTDLGYEYTTATEVVLSQPEGRADPDRARGLRESPCGWCRR